MSDQDKETVLFVGTIDQVQHVNTNRQLLREHKDLKLRACSLLENLLVALRGSETPKDLSTWNMPSAVYYSGQIGAASLDPKLGEVRETILDYPLLIHNYLAGNGVTPIHLPMPYKVESERIVQHRPE